MLLLLWVLKLSLLLFRDVSLLALKSFLPLTLTETAREIWAVERKQ